MIANDAILRYNKYGVYAMGFFCIAGLSELK
jgi:hypothetical protein